MNKNIYVIRSYYQPNTAPINRLMAFIRGYDELNVNVKVVFAFPNHNSEKVKEDYNNVEFIYLWERFKIKNKYIKYFINLLNLFIFILGLKKNTNVIVYGMSKYLWIFRLKGNINLYHEQTESPEVVGRNFSFIGNLKHKIYLKSCKKLEGLFVISPSLKNYFVNEVGLRGEKVHVINMIVDLSRYDNIHVKTKTNTISYCGTISESKDGISYLLKAFALVSDRYNDLSLTLIGGFENFKTELNVLKLIDDLKIESKVNILGAISADNIPLFLSNSKVLALSRPNNKQAQFGFPTKLGEYLMTGNPVVISKVGDFEMYLKDKEDIIFTKPNDANDFADKLLWTLNNYEQAKIIGLNGKQVAARCFNYKIESEKVLQIIFGA